MIKNRNHTCDECKKKTPHHARGLCLLCYNKLYQRRYYKKYHDKVLAYQKEWAKKNRKSQKNDKTNIIKS